VDLAKTPTLTPGSQALVASAPIGSGDRLTPEQRQRYETGVKANPQVKSPHFNTRSGDGTSPNFVGGGVMPLVTKSVDGLTSAQSGGADFPDPAIAPDLCSVIEGTNRAIALNSAPPWHDLVRRPAHRVGGSVRLEFAPLQLPRRATLVRTRPGYNEGARGVLIALSCVGFARTSARNDLTAIH
jgi:hypothetical protein